ncbi:MAG: ankyrin repeat domain-containing protein, partial [Planctomycetota bacterium]
MNAADYFEDAEVIALCEAVERGDLAEVEALIGSGSNVTAVGRHGVTPLLWSYPDDKPAIFEALLKAGADPNVKLTADLGDGRWFNEGDSVTHLCVKSRFDRHFDLVMDHGGDPNITDGRGTTALVTVIRWGRNKKARIKRLVKEGADLNQETRNLARPISVAVTWGAQYDIAILLLELGAEANPDVGGRTLSIPHQVLYEKGEKRYRLWTPEAEASYAALKTAMAERGVDW